LRCSKKDVDGRDNPRVTARGHDEKGKPSSQDAIALAAGNDDMHPMRRGALVLLTGLTLACCGPGERPPAPYFVIPPGPAAPAGEAPQTDRGGLPGPVIVPFPEVQHFLPGPPAAALVRGPAPVPGPGRSATPLYTPPASGPITGYGPGGMAQPPGAPPNPPYPPRGLMPAP
jgi:hypothetical protein